MYNCRPHIYDDPAEDLLGFTCFDCQWLHGSGAGPDFSTYADHLISAESVMSRLCDHLNVPAERRLEIWTMHALTQDFTATAELIQEISDEIWDRMPQAYKVA